MINFQIGNYQGQIAENEQRENIPGYLIRKVQNLVAPLGYFGDVSEFEYSKASSLHQTFTRDVLYKIRASSFIYSRMNSSNLLNKKNTRDKLLSVYKTHSTSQVLFSFQNICLDQKIQPIAALKVILEANGYSKGELKGFWQVNKFKKICKNEIDLSLLETALRLDQTFEIEEEERVAAERFEKIFYKNLQELDVKFQTEHDLQRKYKSEATVIRLEEVEEGYTLVSKKSSKSSENGKEQEESEKKIVETIRIPGRTEIENNNFTPDVLLSTPASFLVECEGVKYDLRWLDCKNFIGGISGFLDDKLIKQAKRYHETFGTGAIVFKYGFTDSFIKSTTPLMASGKIKFLDYFIFEKLLRKLK